MKVDETWVAVPGGRMFTLQWGAGPLLVFAHATGMCAPLYRALLGPLGARYRVVVLDARGHGRTELAADPDSVPWDWIAYRADLKALVAALGGGPVRLAGHSFGATVALEAAAETPGLASSVLLVDPPFIRFDKAAGYRAVRESAGTDINPMARQAARRRGAFPSRAAARAAYHGRGVFTDWPDAALDAYLDGGLVTEDGADTDGSVRLACAPAWESASFRGVSTTLEASIAGSCVPFTILCPQADSTVSEADATAIARLRPDAVIERFPGTGHFLPVTHPELVRPYLLAMP